MICFRQWKKTICHKHSESRLNLFISTRLYMTKVRGFNDSSGKNILMLLCKLPSISHSRQTLAISPDGQFFKKYWLTLLILFFNKQLTWLQHSLTNQGKCFFSWTWFIAQFWKNEQINCSLGITGRISLKVYSLHKTELKIQ